MTTPSALHADSVTTFERTYPGVKKQVRVVRADLAPIVEDFPDAYDFLVLTSELATNAVLHTRSGQPGGTFTVRAEIHPGRYAWVEVEDQGGDWDDQDQAQAQPDDEHGRGLGILASMAGDGNWGIEAGNAQGTCLVWARMDWPEES